MMSPLSKRLTVAFTTSPMRWLYSPWMFSRSASRTLWEMTCLAVCAAMRPSTSVGLRELDLVAELDASASSP